MTASQGKAIVRPVLTSTARTTSKKRYPQASNTIDHLRGDVDPVAARLSVRAVTPMGRFHAEVPRQFSNPDMSALIRRSESKPSLRTSGYASESRILKLLKPSEHPTATVAASPRRSASFTTSVENPLSPRHILKLPTDQFDGAKRVSSTASSASSVVLRATSSRIWAQNGVAATGSETSSDAARGIRTYNSVLRTLPNRVLIPDANGVDKSASDTPRSQARSNSPTFCTSLQLAQTSLDSSKPREHGEGRGLRTTIAPFEHERREVRSFTPTRRYCSDAQRSSSVFKTADEVTLENRPVSQRRACTPPPPPRSRCELSLIDAPAQPVHSGRRRPVSPAPSSASSAVGGDDLAARGRRYFTASVTAIGDSTQGFLGRALSVQRNTNRNASSLIFDWK